MKKTNEEFANDVYSLMQKMRGSGLNESLVAVALLHDVTLYEFMEAADEAYDDAAQLTPAINMKELGYG